MSRVKKNIIHNNRDIEVLSEAKDLLRKRKEKEEYSVYRKKLIEEREFLGIKSTKVFYQILDLYLQGVSTTKLSEQFKYSPADINKMIEDHYRNLINSRAQRVLDINPKATPDNHPALSKLKAIETIGQDFLDILSDNFSETLSEEEALFSWIYVHKGDSADAIEESGLNIGLFPDKEVTYRRAILTRSLYLQNKPNVAAYIKELREKKYYAEDVSKGLVQELLLEEIYKIRNAGDKRDSKSLSRYIELLGKTIGAFTERVEVHEIDPSKALDTLIELAKDCTCNEMGSVRSLDMDQ